MPTEIKAVQCEHCKKLHVSTATYVVVEKLIAKRTTARGPGVNKTDVVFCDSDCIHEFLQESL